MNTVYFSVFFNFCIFGKTLLMKNTFKTAVKGSLFLSILGYFVIFAASCGPAPDPTPAEEEPTPSETGYATDLAIHTHRIGVDPCPQPVSKSIEVFCFKGTEFKECNADSVVISNAIVGLTAVFSSSGTNSATWDASSSTPELHEIDLTFTCARAESFVYKYTLVFYKDGVKVDEEDFEVDVTVI